MASITRENQRERKMDVRGMSLRESTMRGIEPERKSTCRGMSQREWVMRGTGLRGINLRGTSQRGNVVAGETTHCEKNRSWRKPTSGEGGGATTSCGRIYHEEESA